MAITKTAKREIAKNRNKKKANAPKRDNWHSLQKKYIKLVSAGKYEDAHKLLPNVYKTLDKLAKDNLLHKNKAARLKAKNARILKTASTAKKA
ncbi:MAG TPA: 30S ribosomal protein S20 [Candidatus Paceibacterota bacterium]|nr:30S ribosomal protein S20 [Candidatus Paceibacterota bacterium]